MTPETLDDFDDSDFQDEVMDSLVKDGYVERSEGDMISITDKGIDRYCDVLGQDDDTGVIEMMANDGFMAAIEKAEKEEPKDKGQIEWLEEEYFYFKINVLSRYQVDVGILKGCN